MSYLSSNVHKRLPQYDPKANHKDRCSNFNELADAVIRQFGNNKNNEKTHTQKDEDDASSTISSNASRLGAFVSSKFPMPSETMPYFLDLEVSNNEVDALTKWIFDSNDDDENSTLCQNFIKFTQCNEYLVPSRLICLALYLCTQLEISIRKMPGFNESEEGIGLLNQVVKSRLFCSSASSAQSNTISNNTVSSESKIETLIFLLRHVIVEGKGMHLRNLLWHGYLLPTTNVFSSSSKSNTCNENDCDDDMNKNKKETCSSLTLLMCTFLVGMTWKLLHECFDLSTTSNNKECTEDNIHHQKICANEMSSEHQKSSAASSLQSTSKDLQHPPDWDTELFGSSARIYPFTGIPISLHGDLKSGKFAPRFKIISRLQIYFDFLMQHSNGAGNRCREILFPLMCVVFEALIRGLIAELSESGEKSFASLIDTADERYYLVDLEDLLSWQGVYSLQNIQEQKGVLRRGIQRLRDISAELVEKRKKNSESASNDDDDKLNAASDDTNNNSTSSSSSSSLPLNNLLRSGLIPKELFLAFRGAFMTLLPIGPRVRDLHAHGKLSASVICGNCRLESTILGLLQETVSCCFLFEDDEAIIRKIDNKTGYIWKNGSFYNYLQMNIGTATHYLHFKFQKFENVLGLELFPLFSFGSAAADPKKASSRSTTLTLSMKHGLNRKVRPTVDSILLEKDHGNSSSSSSAAIFDHLHRIKDLLKSSSSKNEVVIDVSEDSEFSSAMLTSLKLYTAASAQSLTSWVENEVDCSSEYAIRSSIAIATNFGRLLDAGITMIEESMKKWKVETKKNAKKNDDNEEDDNDIQETNLENLRIIFIFALVLRLFVCAGPSKYLENTRSVATKFSSSASSSVNTNNNNNNRCLLDVTLPIEQRLGKSFARNLSMIESCGGANFSLNMFGKLFLAILDW